MAKETTTHHHSGILLDKRVVERNIRKGLVTRDTYDKALAALPDVAQHSEKIRARLGDEDETDLASDAGEE